MTTKVTIECPPHVENVFWEFHDLNADDSYTRNRGGLIGSGQSMELYIHDTRRVVVSETPFSDIKPVQV